MDSPNNKRTDIKNNNFENKNSIHVDQTLSNVKGLESINYSENMERKCDTKEEQTVVVRRKIDRKRADVNKKLWRRSTIERSGLPPPPIPPESPPTSPVSPTDNKPRPPIISLPNTNKSTEKAKMSPASPTDNNTSPPILREKISRKRQSSIKRQSLPPPPLPPNSP